MPVEETISVPSEDPKKVEKKQEQDAPAKNIDAKPTDKDDKTEELVGGLFYSHSCLVIHLYSSPKRTSSSVTS